MQVSTDVTIIYDGEIADYRWKLAKRLQILGFKIIDNGNMRADGRMIIEMEKPLNIGDGL